MTSDDINIFSAAFSCELNLYTPLVSKSNPYYWRGRKDINHQASPPQSAIDSGELGLTADGDDEGFTSFQFPFADFGGALPGILSNGDQIASVPSSDDGTNFEETPLTSPPDLTNIDYCSRTGPLSVNNDLFDHGRTDAGQDVIAGVGGGTPIDLFSVDDSEASTSQGTILSHSMMWKLTLSPSEDWQEQELFEQNR